MTEMAKTERGGMMNPAPFSLRGVAALEAGARSRGFVYACFSGNLKPRYVPELMPISPSSVALNSGIIR